MGLSGLCPEAWISMNNKFFYLGKTPYSYDWYHLLDSYKKIVRSQDSVLEIGSSNP